MKLFVAKDIAGNQFGKVKRCAPLWFIAEDKDTAEALLYREMDGAFDNNTYHYTIIEEEEGEIASLADNYGYSRDVVQKAIEEAPGPRAWDDPTLMLAYLVSNTKSKRQVELSALPYYVESAHIVDALKSFADVNKGDESTQDLLIALAAEIFDVSEDKCLEMGIV